MAKGRPEVYVSVDIESDGPIPGPYSMLSLGAAAYAEDGTLIDTWTANLNQLEGATTDSSTMEFWARNKLAWEAHRIDTQDPEVAMKNFVIWLKNLPTSRPVFVGYPAGFDFTFTYWYLIKFAKESPFSFAGLDIKSYAMAVLKSKYRDTTKKNMPKNWFPEVKHNHIALDDAIEQGALWMNILKENMNK